MYEKEGGNHGKISIGCAHGFFFKTITGKIKMIPIALIP